MVMISVPLLLCPVHLPIYGSILQSLAPLRMRGAFPSISLFIASVLGIGIGPQMVGIASDLLAPHYGAQSLRWALTGMSILFGSWVILHYLSALRTIDTDTEREDAEMQTF